MELDNTAVPGGGIRAHLLILSVLLVSFSLSGGVSLWFGAGSESALESSLEQNISMLSMLPELRSGVREINFLTELYLKNGWMTVQQERRRAIEGLMDRYVELKALPAAEPAQNVLAQFDRELKALLALQQSLIKERQLEGWNDPDERQRAALRDGRDALMETISTFGDQSALKLAASQFRVHRTSDRLYVARFVAGLLLALAVAFYLVYFILRPLNALEKIARDWALGTPWPAQTLSSLPEIRGLISRFGEMAARLNGAYTKVQEFSQFKTRLVSVVSHEFGNALAVITSAAFLLRENLPPERVDKDSHLLDMISSNVTGLNLATRNLLDMGRHEAGQLAVEFMPTDAARILSEVMTRLQLLYETRDLHVTLEIPVGLEPVRADPAALTLVLSNLLSNAIKYTKPGGRIILGIEREGTKPESYRIFVKDSGIGFSKEEADKIMLGAAYYRTESGKAMTLKGYGIGLSLTKLAVEAHGSELELESSPGQGSRFSFVLPVDASAPGLIAPRRLVAAR